MSEHRAPVQHRWPAGDVMLLIVAALGFALGVILLVPGVPAEGPATAVIYDLLQRPMWGLAWVVISLLPVGAVVYPTHRTRMVAVHVVTVASLLWLAGLFMPLVTEPHVGNALVIIWVFPVALGVVTTWKIGFTNDTIWRPTASARE